MTRTLVTGALGQIGTELVAELRHQFGDDSVVATDIKMDHGNHSRSGAIQEHLDCLDLHQLSDIVKRFDIVTIYHLGALLSAVCEQTPQRAWRVNMDGLVNVLDVAHRFNCAVFFPSSIGAFGPDTPRMCTPQHTIQRPTAMYGITKVAGEMLCEYYAKRFGVDVRGLRLPGLISASAPPGGGTTDYAVDIFHDAVRSAKYRCFLTSDTRLDMMYMADAVRAMMELMQANRSSLIDANAYNISAMNFTPAELAAEIARQLPGFVIEYEVDPIRQAIADSWPAQVDDSAARSQWSWHPAYTLQETVREILELVQQQVGETAIYNTT